MRRTTWLAALALVAVSAVASAQKADPDAAKVAADYQAAFNKGDAKAIAALYTTDGTRLGPDGGFVTGRAAIEKVYTDGFAGPLKGSTLTLQQNTTHAVTADVKVIEGTFSTTGSQPVKGRYVNTIVHEGGQWLLASVVTVPPPSAPPNK